MEIGCTPGLTSPRVATDCCSFFKDIPLRWPQPVEYGTYGRRAVESSSRKYKDWGAGQSDEMMVDRVEGTE